MLMPMDFEHHPKASTEARMGQCPFMRKYMAGEAAPAMLMIGWREMKATWIHPTLGEEGRVGFVMRVDMNPRASTPEHH